MLSRYFSTFFTTFINCIVKQHFFPYFFYIHLNLININYNQLMATFNPTEKNRVKILGFARVGTIQKVGFHFCQWVEFSFTNPPISTKNQLFSKNRPDNYEIFIFQFFNYFLYLTEKYDYMRKYICYLSHFKTLMFSFSLEIGTIKTKK